MMHSRQTRRNNYRRVWTFLFVIGLSIITFIHQARQSFDSIGDFLPIPYQLLNHKKLRNEYSLHILAKFDAIEGKEGLSQLYQCFQKNSDSAYLEVSRRSCPIRCQYESSDVVLYISDNLVEATERDALVIGVLPETLGEVSQQLLHYQFPWKQLVMFYSMESPLSVHKYNGHLRHIPFHIDLTYHDTSYIYLAYALKAETAAKRKVNIPAKTELVAWLGPNCELDSEFWPRAEFVAELGKFLKIDDLTEVCANTTPCSSHLSRECRHKLEGYKFVLAFENSECNQFITDKFWILALSNNVVPIVYGPRKADYLAVAPPNSFIHLSDFTSAKELARYMLRLDTDNKKYFEYFKWKLSYKIEHLYPSLELSYFCNVIPFLADVTEIDVQRVHKSKWFDSCRKPLSKRFEPAKVDILETWKPWL